MPLATARYGTLLTGSPLLLLLVVAVVAGGTAGAGAHIAGGRRH